jgi:hypothetical protein
MIFSVIIGQSWVLSTKKIAYQIGSVDNAKDSFSVPSGLNYEKEGFSDGT